MTQDRPRSVLVTGAGHGIGQAIAVAFAANGDAVVIADRDRARAEAVAAEIRQETGSPTIAIETDVRDAASVEVLVESALSTFGHIDVLVNNAGIYPSSLVVNMTD